MWIRLSLAADWWSNPKIWKNLFIKNNITKHFYNSALLYIFQSPVVIGVQVISPDLRNPSHPHCGSHTLSLTCCALSYLPTASSSIAKAAPIHNLPPLCPIATAKYITISKKIRLLTQIAIFSTSAELPRMRITEQSGFAVWSLSVWFAFVRGNYWKFIHPLQ